MLPALPPATMPRAFAPDDAACAATLVSSSTSLVAGAVGTSAQLTAVAHAAARSQTAPLLFRIIACSSLAGGAAGAAGTGTPTKDLPPTSAPATCGGPRATGPPGPGWR